MRSAPQESCGVFVACNIEGGGNGTDAVIECGNGNENEEKRRSQNRTRTNRESGTGPGLPTGDGNDAGGGKHESRDGRRTNPAHRAACAPVLYRIAESPRPTSAEEPRRTGRSGFRHAPRKTAKSGFQQRTESRDISHGTGFQQVEPLPEDTEPLSAATDRMTISRTGSAI